MPGGAFGTATLPGCGILSSEVDFQFAEITFVDGEPAGYDEYDPQPGSTYERGDNVWVYVAIDYAATNEDDTAKLTFTFQVETPDGDAWKPVEREESWEDAENSIPVYAQEFETTADEEPGDYEMTITVNDRIDGKQITTAERFTLK